MKKANYCKYCGGLINENRECTKCGHKFYNAKAELPKTLAVIFFTATCILLCSTIGYAQMLSSDKAYISRLESENSSLNEQLNEYMKDYEIYSSDFAYYTPNGECYHHPTCHYLENSNEVYAASIYSLHRRNFRACSYCYGE